MTRLLKTPLTVLRELHRWILLSRNRALGLVAAFYYKPDWNRSLAQELEGWTQKSPNRPLLYFEDRIYTYDQANREINRHAHAYKALGIGKGDVAAILMDNRPEFLFHLLGLNKIGAVASLINSDLTDQPLVHAVAACSAQRLVIDLSKIDAVRAACDQWPALAGKIEVDLEPGQRLPNDSPFPEWAPNLEGQPKSDPPETRSRTMDDVCAYIYTSGTTGLPKPAIVKNQRFWRAGRGIGGLGFGMTPYDNLYNCLPLYHTSGITVAFASVIVWGGTMTLARKFSATRFWDDVRRYDCTSFIYIGEALRYLINQPEKPYDRNHSIRRIAGNGLRPEIWEAFRDRFGIDRISEFYGATEGNAETINSLGLVGSVGPFVPWKMRIARWDFDADDFLRDRRGRLIKCKIDEPGVLLGKIKPRNEFMGYANAQETQKKILRDAFKPGDAWYDTGDMLRVDWLNQLHFVDRMGDTFRWKGHNVSTQEVASEINRLAWIDETSVIGVQVPGVEGRTGLASIVVAENRRFDGSDLYRHVDAKLPAYAHPTFIRVLPEMEITCTYKHDKKALKREGYDPKMVADPLFVRDGERRSYLPLDERLHSAILEGKLRM